MVVRNRVLVSRVAVLLVLAGPARGAIPPALAGTTAGEFAVGDDGSASYTIPIQVPPGINGMAPELALLYSSQGRNGPLGVGWSLKGLSAITRCDKTLAIDGVSEAPTHVSSEDALCLDGARLLLVSGIQGAAGSEYRTQKEIFSRVTMLTPASLGFEVRTKQGRILRYSHPWANAWHLTEASDRFENSMRFSYAEMSLIERIDYTTHGSQGPFASVRFSYETRPDVESHKQGGASSSDRTLTRRLRFIETYVGERLVRRYELAYIADRPDQPPKRSRLDWVQECGVQDGELACLPPIDLGWTDSAFVEWTTTSTPTSVSDGVTYVQWLPADFDGDGVTEIAAVDRTSTGTTITLFEPGRNEAGDPIYRAIGSSQAVGSGTNTRPDSWDVGDFNGDGRADLLRIQATVVPEGAAGQNLYLYKVYSFISEGDRFLEPGAGDHSFQYANYFEGPVPQGYYPPVGSAGQSRNNRIVPADVNGDGRTDLIHDVHVCYNLACTGSNLPNDSHWVAVYLASPDGRHSYLGASQDLSGSAHYYADYYGWALLPVDVNQDGRSDYVVQRCGDNSTCSGTRIEVWIASPSGLLTHHTWAELAFRRFVYQPLVGDFNGDALPDLLWAGKWTDNEQIPYLRYILGTGTLFGASANAWPWNLSATPALISTLDWPGSTYAYQKRWLSGDLDLDGRTDLLRISDPPGTPDEVLVQPVFSGATAGGSLSFDYAHPSQEIDPSFSSNDLHFLVDLGEGRAHVVTIEDGGATASIRVSAPRGLERDLITEIENGVGHRIEITYGPVTDPGVHDPGGSASYPQVDLSAPLYVVTDHRETNAPHAMSHTTYTYSDLRYEHLGRGFLGFGSRSIRDETSGRETVLHFRRDFPVDGAIEKREVYVDGGGLIEQEMNCYTVCRISGSTTTCRTMPPIAAECPEHAQRDGQPPVAPTGQDRFYVVVDESTLRTFEPNARGAIAQEVHTTRTGDSSYNNPDVVTVKRSAGGVTFTETKDLDHANDAAEWLIGRLVRERLTHSAPGTPDIVRETEFIVDPGTVLPTRVIRDPGTDFELIETYAYDSYGNVASKTVQGGSASAGTLVAPRTTTFDYTSASGVVGRFLERQVNAEGHHEEWDYDERFGVVTQHRGPSRQSEIGTTLIRETAQVDPLGRVVQQTAPGGAVTATSIEAYSCASGRADCLANVATLVTRQLPEGRPASAVYSDSQGREVRRETVGFDGSLVYVDTQYDERGRILRVSQPYRVDATTGELPAGSSVYWTESFYDELDRVYETHGPDHTPANPSVSRIYHGLASQVTCAGDVISGLETRATDPTGRERREVRDARGKLICVIEEMGSRARFEYDAEGLLLVAWNLLDSTPIAVQRNVYARPGPGYLVSRTDADMGTWTFRHDALGQLQRRDDAKGQILSMTYDRLGRPRTRLEPEGLTIWTWDTAAHGVGQLAAVSSPETTYFATHAYDAYGRLTTTTKRIGGTSYAVTRSWDAYGRPGGIDYPMSDVTGFSIRYGYNASGHLQDIHDASNPGVVYWQATEVDAYGNVTKELLGNGRATERFFDAARGLPRAILTSLSGEYDVQDLEYDWDKLGSLSRRSDSRLGLQEVFAYDALNRLSAVSLNSALSQAITYDTLGNIKTKSSVSAQTWSYYPDRPHALMSTGETTYQYDENGNEISAIGARSRTSAYRSHNKPCKISRGAIQSAFFYGPDRELIMSLDSSGTESGVHTYFDDLFEHERGNAGSTTDVYVNYVRVNGRLVAALSHHAASGSLWKVDYYHSDHLGSVDAITDGSGTLVKRQSYDAWGRRRYPESWSAASAYFFASQQFQDAGVTPGFAGHKALDHLELVHMGGRVYDPFRGQFMTPDPVVQFAASAQGWNAYAYAGNNPLSALDPDGYSWKSFWKGIFKAWKSFWKGVYRAWKSAFALIVTAVATVVLGPASPAILPIMLGSTALQGALEGASIQEIFLSMALGLAVGSIGNVLAPYAAKGLSLLGAGLRSAASWLAGALPFLPGVGGLWSLGSSILGALRSGYEWLFPEGEWITAPGVDLSEVSKVRTNGIFGWMISREDLIKYVIQNPDTAIYYNPSRFGGLMDFVEAAKQKFLPFLPDPLTRGFARGLRQIGHPVAISAHSQGVLTVVNAATLYDIPAGSTLQAFGSPISTARIALGAKVGHMSAFSSRTDWFDAIHVLGPSFNPVKTVSGVADVFCGFCVHNGYAY
jgi:RHS repeat-associated protein